MTDIQRAAARDRIEPGEVESLRAALVFDERRRRPLWFDGRFLAARDLTREQDYFLTRQADAGRANGSGVIAGLTVESRPPNALRIRPGFGITPAGELVAVPKTLDLDILDLAESQKLDAAFGLAAIPSEPARTRAGLFIVALRPVEFAANPITSYPKTLTEQRTAHQGDIVEAVAVTLIPYPDEGSAQERAGQRARIARDIFLRGASRAFPANALPLAMLSLVNGVVQWVDQFMVRREVGAAHGDSLSLGFAPRALREAHFQQYRTQLRDVLDERGKTRRGEHFPASEHFLTIPPAGPMPSAAINPADLTQVFFPQSIDVEVSLLPDDELRVLLEESMLLPPIDLSLSAAEQESTAVLILIPLPRHRISKVLAGLTAPAAPEPPAPVRLGPFPALRKPAQSLQLLLRSQVERAALPLLRPEIRVPDNWRALLAESRLVWYVRRRNLTYKESLSGIRMPAAVNDVEQETEFNTAIAKVGLLNRYTALRTRATTRASAEMLSTLSQPKIASSPTLLENAVKLFEDQPALDQKTARLIAARLCDPKLGEGIARLVDSFIPQDVVAPQAGEEPAVAPAPPLASALAELPNLVELDALIRVTPEQELPKLAETLAEAAGKGGGALHEAVVRKLEDHRP